MLTPSRPRKYFLSTIAKGESFDGEGGIATGLAAHRILAGETIDSPEGAALARVFPESELGRRAERASRIEREFDFMLYVDDLVLRGQIDLWFEQRASSSWSITTPIATNQRSTSMQCSCGCTPWRSNAMPGSFLIALPGHLLQSEPRSCGISEGELVAAKATVGAFQEAQESLEFPLRVGEQCKRCEFFGNRCPASL